MITVIVGVGCRPNLPTIAPSGMMPGERSTVVDWTEPYRPTRAREYRIRPWRYRNELGAAAGRARGLTVMKNWLLPVSN